MISKIPELPEFSFSDYIQIHERAVLRSNGEIPIISERLSEWLKMRYTLNPVYTLYNVYYTETGGGDRV